MSIHKSVQSYDFILDFLSLIMVTLSGSLVPWKVLGTSFLTYRVWEKSHFTNIVPDFIFSMAVSNHESDEELSIVGFNEYDTDNDEMLLASDLVLWEPMHGRAQQGRPRQSYLSMLLKEVGTNSKEELRTLMRDRDIWRGLSGMDRT